MNIERVTENPEFDERIYRLMNTLGILNKGSIKCDGKEPEFSYMGEHFYIDESLHPAVQHEIEFYIRRQLWALTDYL